MRPIFEQAADAATVGPGIEMGALIGAEPREERQIMGADEDVDRIDLQQAEPLDGPAQAAPFGHDVGPRVGKTLRRKGEAARFGSR